MSPFWEGFWCALLVAVTICCVAFASAVVFAGVQP